MKCIIKFYRPYDRTPSDHQYGEPFDESLNKFVGGKESWDATDPFHPIANIDNPKIEISLHEDGPEFMFFIEHSSEISAYVSALASLIASWVTVRSIMSKPKNKFEYEKDGTILKIGDIELKSKRDLDQDEILDVLIALESVAKDEEKNA